MTTERSTYELARDLAELILAKPETCLCGEWPVSEYGRICPSCARPRFVIWDWKEQPDFDEIRDLTTKGFVYLYLVEDTGCDSYVLVASRVELSPPEVQRTYEEEFHG